MPGERYLLKVAVRSRQQADGGWVAKSADLPVFVAAPTREELDRRVAAALDHYAGYILRTKPPDQPLEACLRELGVPYEWVPSGEHAPAGETVTVPVPV